MFGNFLYYFGGLMMFRIVVRTRVVFRLVLLLSLAPAMGYPQDLFVETSAVPIRYIEQGEGTPVILIHGYTGSLDSWMQTGTFELLAGKFRTIALDCRGHGRSGTPHGATSYGLAMVDDVIRLLDWLEIEKAHIVGYSMGAEIALRLATRAPNRVQSLAIGGSGWSGEHDEANYHLLADSLETSASFGPVLRTLTPQGQPAPSDELIASLDQTLQEQDIDALVAVARSMDYIINLSRQEVANIGVPIFGIAGEHDPERPNLERMNGVAPRFVLKILPGRDHIGALSDPQFNASILEFLTSTTDGDAANE